MRRITFKDFALVVLLIVAAVGYSNRESIGSFFEKKTAQTVDLTALTERVTTLEKDVKSLKEKLVCEKPKNPEKPLGSKVIRKKGSASTIVDKKTSVHKEEAIIESKTTALEQKEETFIEDPKKPVFKEVIPEGGCIYKSDGTAVLKNGSLVAAGIEIARIHNKELIKEYPYAISTDANHAKACHAWSEKMAKTLQKGDSYVNNDTHRTN